jgi:hypothetical protein
MVRKVGHRHDAMDLSASVVNPRCAIRGGDIHRLLVGSPSMENTRHDNDSGRRGPVVPYLGLRARDT